MEEIKLDYSASQISIEEIKKLEKKIQIEITNMINTTKQDYQDDRASINLPDDKKNLLKVKNLINKKNSKQSRRNQKWSLMLIGSDGTLRHVKAYKPLFLLMLFMLSSLKNFQFVVFIN